MSKIVHQGFTYIFHVALKAFINLYIYSFYNLLAQSGAQTVEPIVVSFSVLQWEISHLRIFHTCTIVISLFHAFGCTIEL